MLSVAVCLKKISLQNTWPKCIQHFILISSHDLHLSHVVPEQPDIAAFNKDLSLYEKFSDCYLYMCFLFKELSKDKDTHDCSDASFEDQELKCKYK